MDQAASLGCHPVTTNKESSYPYEEYYLGETDEQKRRNGDGQNNWTGAKSLEWYTGLFIRDTMHGNGDYRWRYLNQPGLFYTYEGNFYANSFHGYGVMSFPDGKVFTGLFNNNARYGPGVETFADRTANVGLWRGERLARLAWRPAAPSVVPELAISPAGRLLVEPHRRVLRTTHTTFGKINNAVELLKECGCDPLVATENWSRLYPKHCTDMASQLCHVDLFKHDYYNGRLHSLKIQNSEFDNEITSKASEEELEDPEIGPYYAWNNDEAVIDMMRHCFEHERQRNQHGVDLMSVLSGPRKQFLRAAIHELDCRTLLMAVYLGHIASTTFLINDRGVDPNISDMQGNSAVMYATCGDQVELINFLVEAGAHVDSYNDACCTALGVALMRFACAQRDVPIGSIVAAVLPAPAPAAPIVPHPSEWNMNRELPSPPLAQPPPQVLIKSHSKQGKLSERSTTKLQPLKDSAAPKKKPDDGNESDDSINEENKLYKDIKDNYEYINRVNELFLVPSGPPNYLFDVYDMVADVLLDDDKVTPEKNLKKKEPSKVKDINKFSKEAMWQTVDKDDLISMTSAEKQKAEMLDRIKATVLQLLENGADPNLVKFPQPAIYMAVVSSSADLVSMLINHGAETNVVYPELNYYTMIDLAVSRPMTYEGFETVKALLEGGARVDHRLRYVVPEAAAMPAYEIPGPTLLHAVLSRKLENDYDEETRKLILELLLEYNCDPLAQFRGRSAFDVAARNVDLLDIVVRSPKTDLNAVINDSDQTILVKMFTMSYFRTINSSERLQMLTNLLLFGADPLIPCKNGDAEYKNLFVYTNKVLTNLDPSGGKQAAQPDVKNEKGKKEPKKEEKGKNVPGPTKSTGKMNIDDLGNYKMAVDLITECARLMHIRWLQAKLTKELIEVIDKYKHRCWSVILRDCKNSKAVGLWLMAPRCLEIWELLRTTKKEIYNDKCTLKYLLSIVHFCYLRTKACMKLGPVMSVERDLIDREVKSMLREHKMAANFETEMLPVQRLYVQPELWYKADYKFDVCFECVLPFEEEKITCQRCKLVSFCNLECMKANTDRVGCHPCSPYLKRKYFPESSNEEII